MNSKKYMLDLVLSISAIVICGFLILINLFALVTIISVFQRTGYAGDVTDLILNILMIGLLVVCLVLSIKMCIRTSSKKGASKELTVGLLIIFIMIAVLYLVNIFLFNIFSVYGFLLFGAFITVCGISLGTSPLPDPPQQTPLYQPQQNVQPTQRPLTIEEKIAELKRLKELYVISDEQYSEAIQKLIQDTIQK